MSDILAPNPSADDDGPRGADQFVRDDRAEKILIDTGVAFDFRALDLTAIDLSAFDRESERQMRDEIIHADVAHRYAADLEAGGKFPAGVLSEHRGMLRIVDFHHRLWAARAAQLTQVSAYVVGALEEFDLIELGNLLNRNHGVPLADPERIRQALWGLEIGRFKTIRHAARILGLPEQKLNTAKRRVDARSHAADAGVPLAAFDKLAGQSQVRLGSIDSPEVFKAAALSAINKGLGASEVNELVKLVNDAGGDKAKMDVVHEYAADIAPRASVHSLSDPWNRLHAACRSVLGVDLDAFIHATLVRDAAALRDCDAEIIETMSHLVSLGEAAHDAFVLTERAESDADRAG